MFSFLYSLFWFPLKTTYNKDIIRIRTQSLQSAVECHTTFTLVLPLRHIYLVNLRLCIAVLFSFRSKLYIDYIFLNKLFSELPRRYFIEQHTNRKKMRIQKQILDNIYFWIRKQDSRRSRVRSCEVPLARHFTTMFFLKPFQWHMNWIHLFFKALQTSSVDDVSYFRAPCSA